MDGVHVDAGVVRGHVDRGADPLGPAEHLGQRPGSGACVAGRDPLVDQGRETADEVDAAPRRPPRRGSRRPGPANRAKGPPKPPATTEMGLTEIRVLTMGTPNLRWTARTVGTRFSHAGDPVPDAPPGFPLGMGTGTEDDPHGDGPDVQILQLDHPEGFEDLFGDRLMNGLDPVHDAEDVLVLDHHLHAQLLALPLQGRCEGLGGRPGPRITATSISMVKKSSRRVCRMSRMLGAVLGQCRRSSGRRCPPGPAR